MFYPSWIPKQPRTGPRQFQECLIDLLFYLDFYREGNGYKFSIEDIGHLADSPRSFADEINKKIENDVLANPEQYFWHHRRFKSQNPAIYD